MGLSFRELLPVFARPFARLWYALNPGARILMYHRVSDRDDYDQLTVSPDNFEEQIRWLNENRRLLSLPDLISAIQNGSAAKNSVAITFDDGYLDNLENALPILEKYQVPATIYVTSDFAAQKISHPRYRSDSKRLHLNWQEVRSLAQHPLIRIGSHTKTHPMLSQVPLEQVTAEIRDSKADIEQMTGVEVSDFCYPSGNFTEREERIVRESGYTNAVTVKPGINNRKTGLFALRRTEITDRDSLNILEQKLDGAFDIFHWLLDVKREMNFSRQRERKKAEIL